MSEVKKIATRASYGAALVELGKEHEDLVVLDADLAAATQTGMFKKEFPERHIDCGIAECNMMGIAAGLATTGKVPFASTFAMFAAGRAYEQLRNSVAYPKLNVKVGATHGGISVGEDGATHQCCEDFALMRAIPGMVVMSPSDDVEAKAMVKAAYEYVGPDSPNTSLIPIRLTGTGAFSERHSHTAPPKPPIIECSSTVTTLPVSLAAATISSSSSGLIVWILITFASIPSAASFSAASREAATQSPFATIVRSFPSRRTMPLPISNL